MIGKYTGLRRNDNIPEAGVFAYPSQVLLLKVDWNNLEKIKEKSVLIVNQDFAAVYLISNYLR